MDDDSWLLMDSLGNKVRKLYMSLPKCQQMFLGAPPFSSEIDRELSNYEVYLDGIVPLRKRISLGSVREINSKIVGFQSTTLLLDADPTFYEKKYLGLNKKLSYAQLKKIFVDVEFQGQGISELLLDESIDFSEKFSIGWVTDVKASNIGMIKFLEKHKIRMIYEWRTAKGTDMYRFSR